MGCKKCYTEEHGRGEDGVHLIEERVRRVARFSEVEIQPYVIGSSDFDKTERRSTYPVDGKGKIHRIALLNEEKSFTKISEFLAHFNTSKSHFIKAS